MTEHLLCNAIVEYLNYHGCWVWRTNSGAIRSEYKGKTRLIRMARAGTSDIIGMDNHGRFIAIEVKLPKTRTNVTLNQEMFLDDVKRHGGISGVACSPEEAIWVIEGKV
jgi:hypothetical protein